MAVLVWSKFDSTLGQAFNPINPLLSSVAGGMVSRIDPDSTGLNPSWRNALSEVYITASWPEGSTADSIFQQNEEFRQSTLILDQLTTDSGSYLNEVKKKILNRNQFHLLFKNLILLSFPL